jgi:hypothetical protein
MKRVEIEPSVFSRRKDGPPGAITTPFNHLGRNQDLQYSQNPGLNVIELGGMLFVQSGQDIRSQDSWICAES